MPSPTPSSPEQIAEETARATAAIPRLRGRVALARGPAIRRLRVPGLLRVAGRRRSRRAMCDTRLPRIAGEAFMEVSSSPRRVEVGGAGGALPQSGAGGARPDRGGAASLGPRRSRLARGRRGRRPASAGSPTSGCGCWKGSRTARRWRCRRHGSRATASRASTSRTRCSSTRERSRATRATTVEECIVRLAAEMLDAREVSLWLQAAPGAELAAVAVVGRGRGAP